MESVSCSSTMAHTIMVHLIKALFMVKADLFQALKCITKDRLEEMLLKGLESVLIKDKVMCIMVNGWMICPMAKVNKIGKMELNIKDSLQMGLKMVKVY